MLKFISRNKLKISLVFLMIIFLTALSYYYFTRNKDDNNPAKDYEQTRDSELPPSGLDPALLIDMNKLINDMKFAEAKAMIDRINEDALTQGDRLMLNSSRLQACTQLKDLACLDKVIEFNKNNDQDNLHVYLAAGSIATDKKLEEERKAYYKEALNLIDSRGGQEYVSNINNSSQAELNYDQIKKGSEE